jgi:hypothetical protein
MGTPKLRLVFYEDEKETSYFYLEKSEAQRVISILKILPEFKDWTPISKIAETIGSKLPATLWTIQKMAGAEKIDIKMPDGVIKVIARKPVLLVHKKQFNTRNNLLRQKYLKATVMVKCIK